MKTTPALALAGLIALGACSQQAACIYDAREDLQTLEALNAQTRANLDRGYAMGTRERVMVVDDICKTRQPDGSEVLHQCQRTTTETETFPVSIDLNAERAKLQSQERRLEQMRRDVAARVAQCKATYPE